MTVSKMEVISTYNKTFFLSVSLNEKVKDKYFKENIKKPIFDAIEDKVIRHFDLKNNLDYFKSILPQEVESIELIVE